MFRPHFKKSDEVKSNQAPLEIKIMNYGVPINGDTIVGKLLKFLESLPEHDRKIVEVLRQEQNWHCFGFTLCHAAMDAIGKVRWWEAALFAVAQWDTNDVSSLDRPVILPDADPTKPHPTLRAIFERVLNYVVYHQASDVLHKFVKIDDLNLQRDMFKPAKKFFEMVVDTKDAKSEIKSITQVSSVAGKFTEAQLSQLLIEDEFNITDRIGMLYGAEGVHTIRIAYNNAARTWRIYDSATGYPSSQGTFYRDFATKKEAISEIMNNYGDSLSIYSARLSPLEKKDTPSEIDQQFDQLIKQNPAGLLQELGLSEIALHAPTRLPFILERASKTSEGRGIIVKAMNTAGSPHGTYSTGLQTVARYAPDSFSKLLDCVHQTPNGCEELAKALIRPNNQRWTGLHTVARYNPASLDKFLDYVHEAKQGPDEIANGLAAISASGHTGLDIVLQCAPESLSKLLEYAKHSPNGADLIERGLEIKWNGESNLEYIEGKGPSYSMLVKEFIAKKKMLNIIDSIQSERKDEPVECCNNLRSIVCQVMDIRRHYQAKKGRERKGDYVRRISQIDALEQKLFEIVEVWKTDVTRNRDLNRTANATNTACDQLIRELDRARTQTTFFSEFRSEIDAVKQFIVTTQSKSSRSSAVSEAPKRIR